MVAVAGAAGGAEGELLAQIAARLEARVGIRPPAWLLTARAERRAGERGAPLAAYLGGLLGDDDELDRLIEVLRVGETRFFRHPAQLAALRAEVLPAARARAQAGRRPLRAWSAGCASGEETWTLAMLLAALDEERAEAGDAAVAPPEVLGTDLSDAALRAAEAGRYGAEAAAPPRVPAELAARFLRAAGPGLVTIAPSLRQAVGVRFARHNLLDARYPGPFDVILCRNVLIYFEEARQRQIVARLRAQLHDGGHLLLGPSEERQGERALIERASAGASPGDAAAGLVERSSAGLSPGDGPVTGAPGASGQVASLPSAQDLAVLRLLGGYGDGERLKDELRPHLAAGRALTVHLDGADYLGEGDARVLRRAAELVSLRLRAARPAVLRWLQRQQLAVEGG